MSIITADKTDNETYNWRFSEENPTSVYPPAVCRIDGTLYRLNGFSADTDTFYLTDAETHLDALRLSAAGDIPLTIADFSGLVFTAEKLGVDPQELEIFSKHQIKGQNSFQTLRELAFEPQELKSYIAEKNISLKILGLYMKLPARLKNTVIQFIREESPSVSSFRNTVQLYFDLKPDIQSYDKEETMKLAGVRDSEMKEFQDELNRLAKQCGADVSSDDNFETANLTFSFTVNSFDEYLAKLNEIYNSRDKALGIFRFLTDNDIH